MSSPLSTVIWTNFIGKRFLQGLSESGYVDLQIPHTENECIQRTNNAAVLITDDSKLDAAFVDAVTSNTSKLRWIQLANAGYDNACRAAIPEHITVTNVGSILAPVVAEHAIALMLALTRRIPEMVRLQNAALYNQEPFRRVTSIEGSRVAIVGFGNVGIAFARRIRAFGAHIVAVTRTGSSHPDADEAHSITNLEKLLPSLDIVVLALPLSDATRGFFGSKQIESMKWGAMLINVGRGELVDTRALEDALVSGRLGGAALDVLSPEPLPQDHTLWRAPNCLISPHLGGWGRTGASQHFSSLFIENVRRYLAGAALLNILPLGSHAARKSKVSVLDKGDVDIE